MSQPLVSFTWYLLFLNFNTVCCLLINYFIFYALFVLLNVCVLYIFVKSKIPTVLLMYGLFDTNIVYFLF